MFSSEYCCKNFPTGTYRSFADLPDVLYGRVFHDLAGGDLWMAKKLQNFCFKPDRQCLRKIVFRWALGFIIFLKSLVFLWFI